MADGRSKVRRLGLRIERELLVAYSADTALDRRRLRQAARFAAISEQTMLSIGRDRKATRRGAVAAQTASDRLLAQLQPAPRVERPPSASELLPLPARVAPVSAGAILDAPMPEAPKRLSGSDYLPRGGNGTT